MTIAIQSTNKSSKLLSAGVGAATFLAALSGPKLVARSQDSLKSTEVSSTQRMSAPLLLGPLSNLRAPTYDGPVKWGYRTVGNDGYKFGAGLGLLCSGVVFAVVGGAALIFTGWRRCCSEITGEVVDIIDEKSIVVAGCIGVAISTVAGSLFFGKVTESNAYAITFPTEVADVHMMAPGYYVQHSKSVSGPYFSQLVTVKESSIPFAASAKHTQFVIGQKINATVYVDKSTGQILCWSGEAGARPE